MTISNQEMLEAASSLGRMGVNKAASPTVMTTDSLKTGEFMDRTQVERLVDLTVSQSGWLSTTTVRLRSQKSGEIPRLVINDVVTEGVSENAGKTISTHPDTDHIEYQTGKFQATWYLTYEDLREARASGEPDFDNKVRRAFAKAMGNDMARAALLGDTSLDASTRLNRLLRKRDGWLKQIRARGQRSTTTKGMAYSRALWDAMLDAMPQEYSDDPDLRWMFGRKLDQAFTQELGSYGENAGLQEGGRAMLQRQRFTPLGIPQLLVPQMPHTLGAETVTNSAQDASTVADDGDGTITIGVNDLFDGYDADHAGRKVTVTNNTTGQSETLTVQDSGGALKVFTTGSLGQSSISTTVGDYTVDYADLTSAVLGNPANLFVVLCDKVRAYQKFEQEFERIRIDVFYDADYGLFNEDAVVLQDGVIAPSFAFGE